MPEEIKKPSEKPVDIDTSGPEFDVALEEPKEEEVVETKEQESIITEVKREEPVQKETVREIKKEQKEDDSKLEEYSKSVQSRIAKLTRKMREAERREKAATEYASSLEKARKLDQDRFQKVDSDYTKKFEDNIKTGMESAQNELARAIESGDAQAQVQANKRIATLAFENAKLEQRKENAGQEKPVQLSDGGQLPKEAPQSLPQADPMAEDWAGKNPWFGQNRAMTFTAFEIHKDLVEKEGFDPKSNEYYAEIDRRIRVDFPNKFDNSGDNQSPRPVQSVASANRSVKPGRKTVRLTSSQVHIAKKLGVPLEDYAKQLKLTEGA
jgi:hypothetical protein